MCPVLFHEIRYIGSKWPMTQMADGHLGQELNDLRPFRPVSSGQWWTFKISDVIWSQKSTLVRGGSRISHWGGTNPHLRGCQSLTQALFGENICKNERIWSCWGGVHRKLLYVDPPLLVHTLNPELIPRSIIADVQIC